MGFETVGYEMLWNVFLKRILW